MHPVDNSGEDICRNSFQGGSNVRIGAFTDTGKTRKVNEDSFFVSNINDDPSIVYCIIADGMGGHNAGEVASKIAIEQISDYIQKAYNKDLSQNQVINVLQHSMNIANRAIYAKALESDDCYGMGTTAVICLVHQDDAFIAHIGDSRAYIIRDNNMYQITTDHSMVEELVSNGTITREQADCHPQKNVITRALGDKSDVKADIYIHTYAKNDIILICTDGLTNMLRDSEILAEMTECEDMQSAVEKLVHLSNDRGGLDNITVVALSF